jgi:hypothetical protein
MGIKLEIMKKILVLISVFYSFGCKAQQLDLQKEKEWVWSFKSVAIYSCLCELTKEGIDQELIKNNDISFMAETEILDLNYSKKADSIGRDYAKKVTPVFSDDSEFAGRKAIFTSCLSLYDNDDFKKIIEAEYTKYQNPDSIKN